MQAEYLYLLLQYCIWYWLVCCRVWLPSWRPLVTSSLSWTPSTPTTTLVKSCWSSFESSSLLMRKWRKLCWRQVCCPGMCGTVCHITVTTLCLVMPFLVQTTEKDNDSLYTQCAKLVSNTPCMKAAFARIKWQCLQLKARHGYANSTKITVFKDLRFWLIFSVLSNK